VTVAEASPRRPSPRAPTFSIRAVGRENFFTNLTETFSAKLTEVFQEGSRARRPSREPPSPQVNVSRFRARYRRRRSRRRAQCGSDPALFPSIAFYAAARCARRLSVRRRRPSDPTPNRAVAPARTPIPAFRADVRAPETRSGRGGCRDRRAERVGSVDLKTEGNSSGDPFGPAAPEQRTHTGHQFDHRKRLDHIVVGADREAAHPV
jgi:hypothetical protein